MESFKSYLLKEDIFGFEQESAPPKSDNEDDLPIKSFSPDILMKYLLKPLGNRQAREPEEGDSVQYGIGPGSLRVKFTPNLGVILQRLITDLDGNPTWITKRLYKINLPEFAEKENLVARDIFFHLKNLSKEQIDSASKHYDKLYYLTKEICLRLNKANIMFANPEIKKVSENNYNILLSVAGFGVGKLVGQSKSTATPAGITDISFDPSTGLIKCMFYTVSLEGESGSWEIDVPYFTGLFVSTQNITEISNAVLNGIKFI